jgi:glycosyltransferase involved in cell wall biosynthesis
LVAIELARAGDAVNVWAPALHAPGSVEAVENEDGIIMHGLSALRILDRALHATPGRILVQYTPHAFGWKAMNVPLVLWLYARCKMDIAVMFHEVAFPLRRSQPLRHNLLGGVNRTMAALAARAARRIFISTPSWEVLLRRLVPGDTRIMLLPIPSNIPVVKDGEGIAAIRRSFSPAAGPLVGHFGTYGRDISSLLDKVLPALLYEVPSADAILIGRNSEKYRSAITREHPELARRIHASGARPAYEISLCISACDLLVQPYPDGIATRSGAAMAGVAHGRAIVTNSGALTEPLWRERQAVAIAPTADIAALARDLLADTARREQFAKSGASLYADQFDISHTIATLRAA